MKHSTKKLIAPALIGGCLLAATSSWAVEVYLHASTLTKDLPGKPGVLMWGFGTNGQPATVPGPQINVPVGDPTLIIHLQNNLSSKVSLVIPNQNGFVVDAPPTIENDDQGRPRARSFVKETAPSATGTYQWNNVTPGTYLYHSGSHASLQVQMGLYGAMVKKASATEAYPGKSAQNEKVVLFSEVDTKVHDAVANNKYGPGADPANPPEGWVFSTIHSVPDYFLINGQPSTDGSPINIMAGLANQSVLLRMLNASVNSHIPVLPGFHHQIIAEDGRPYASGYPKNLAAPELTALKTMDSLITPTAGGLYPIYDRSLGLANGTDSAGGMLAYLGVGQTFVRPGTILIPSGTDGNPAPHKANVYPATITVSGVPGKIGKVTASLRLSHTLARDVDVLLQSPNGTQVKLMSDVGQFAINSQLTFDDEATLSLPPLANLVSGTYKPSDQAPDEVFPAPAGDPPYASTLSAFNGGDPNGTWSFFVIDDTVANGGSIANLSINIIPAQ